MSVEPAPRSSPKRRAKFAVGGSIIFLTLVGLVVWATLRPGSTVFYMTASEVVAAGSFERDHRLNGTVLPGSIEQDGLTTTFVVTDGATEVEVMTEAPLPDAFKDRSEVVALGTFDGDAFSAHQVLAKCPSKFKARA
jgi:cytochrome c-type biogenesis protein CcmE